MANVKITTGGQERVDRAADVITRVFASVPTTVYMFDQLSEEVIAANVTKFNANLLSAVVATGGSIEEADDWRSCGVLCLPECHKADWRAAMPDRGEGFARVLGEAGMKGLSYLISLQEEAKSRIFAPDEQYCYILFLATEINTRGRGLCSALVQHYQQTAQKQRMPLMLEAVTESAKNLYLKLGFYVAKDLIYSPGEVNKDGRAQAGGPGVSTWVMVWRPELQNAQ